MTEVFVEQPLASPGSAKNLTILIPEGSQKELCVKKIQRCKVVGSDWWILPI